MIGTNVTLGKDGTSRSYQPAQADTNYAMYAVISNSGNFTGNNVVYEQKQEYALKFKGADYTFSNFVCSNAEVSTKKDTVASVTQGTNVDYTKDYIVEDTRDNKYYIVRKLYMRRDDGTINTACWMTQNLDLDLVAQYDSGNSTASIYAYNRENNTKTKLTTTNSDLYDTWSTASNIDSNMLYAYTGGTNDLSQNWQTSYKFATLASGASPSFPASTSTDNHVTPSGMNNPGNNPGMIDPGDVMFGPFDRTISLSITPAENPSIEPKNCETNDTKCYQFRNIRYFASKTSGHIISDNSNGNFYNWYSATAGTGNSSVTIHKTDVPGSICPQGWDLPTGIDDNNDNNYGQLMSAYFPAAGVTHQDNTTVYTIGNNYTGFTTLQTLKSNSDNILAGALLSFVRSNGAGPTSASSVQGAIASYWSVVSADTTDTYGLISYSGMLSPGNYPFYRGNAFTMRCVQGI